MALFYIASRATTRYSFRGGQNNCSLMLYLTTEQVFENVGVGSISWLTSAWFRDLLARFFASLRKKSCKRLESRAKQSIKRWLSLLIF